MSAIGTRLQDDTKRLAEHLFKFATPKGAEDPFGEVVVIDEFAAKLPESFTHHYSAPTARADKRGNLWRATLGRRTELVSALKRGGPTHDPAFTLRRVAMGTYEIATPERAIVVNKNTKQMTSLAKHLRKEGQRLLSSVDYASLPNVEPADLERIMQPMDMVVGQLEALEKYGRQVLETAKEQVKRLSLGSGAYVFDPANPERHLTHAAWRTPKAIAAPEKELEDA